MVMVRTSRFSSSNHVDGFQDVVGVQHGDPPFRSDAVHGVENILVHDVDF